MPRAKHIQRLVASEKLLPHERILDWQASEGVAQAEQMAGWQETMDRRIRGIEIGEQNATIGESRQRLREMDREQRTTHSAFRGQKRKEDIRFGGRNTLARALRERSDEVFEFKRRARNREATRETDLLERRFQPCTVMPRDPNDRGMSRCGVHVTGDFARLGNRFDPDEDNIRRMQQDQSRHLRRRNGVIDPLNHPCARRQHRLESAGEVLITAKQQSSGHVELS
jgi:hypothetical protein